MELDEDEEKKKSIVKDKEWVVNNSNLSDKVAALINIFFMIGSSVGPIMGGYLNDLIGFAWSLFYLSMFSAVFGLIYCFMTFICYKTKQV